MAFLAIIGGLVVAGFIALGVATYFAPDTVNRSEEK